MKPREKWRHIRIRPNWTALMTAIVLTLLPLGPSMSPGATENMVDVSMLPKLMAETYKNYSVDIIVMDEPRSEKRKGGTTKPAHGKVELNNAVDPIRQNHYRILATYKPDRDFVGQDSFLLSTETTVYHVIVKISELPPATAGSFLKGMLYALLKELGVDPDDYVIEVLLPFLAAILVIGGIIVIVIVRDGLPGRNRVIRKNGRP